MRKQSRLARELPEVTQNISCRQNIQRSNPTYLTDKQYSPASNYSQSPKILLVRAFRLEPCAFRQGFSHKVSSLMLLVSANADCKDAIKLILTELFLKKALKKSLLEGTR